MAPAQPAHVKGCVVALMMRVDRSTAAHLTALPLQHSRDKRASHGQMGLVLREVRTPPVRLPGLALQKGQARSPKRIRAILNHHATDKLWSVQMRPHARPRLARDPLLCGEVLPVGRAAGVFDRNGYHEVMVTLKASSLQNMSDRSSETWGEGRRASRERGLRTWRGACGRRPLTISLRAARYLHWISEMQSM